MSNNKIGLIFGITGQQGSYLAELLLEKDYEVHGFVRRVSTPNVKNIEHILEDITIHEGDLTDLPSIISCVEKVRPHEIYNLAAQSFVGTSWTQPILTANVTGLGAVNVFEAARQVDRGIKILQASSTEMFSGEKAEFLTEETPFKPKSPYGVSKLFSHEMARVWCESYGMFISCAIMSNNESPRRGIEFVTQKIVDTAVRQIKFEEDIVLELGNLEPKRDWSHSKDIVKGLYSILQYPQPDTFLLASGKMHSIKEFVDKTYNYLGVELNWNNNTFNNLPVAHDKDGNILVESTVKYYRPNEVNTLLGNPRKAVEELSWDPEYNLDDLIKDMIDGKSREKLTDI